MTLSGVLWRGGIGLSILGSLCAFQRPFRAFPGVEYSTGSLPLPPDYQEKTEWAFARLMFPGGGYDAVQVGEWGLTAQQGKELREYLLRGGFFMADDFHGDYEWQVFERGIRLAFPDLSIKEIPDDDPIFHTVYDIDRRYQLPGADHVRLGYKRPLHPIGPEDGKGAHWRAIYDDKGRILVAISYNSDVGDAWEWADDPRYPAPFADLAMRMGVNYIVYAMTH